MSFAYLKANVYVQVANLSEEDQKAHKDIVERMESDADAFINDPARIEDCLKVVGRRPMKRSDPFFIENASLGFHMKAQGLNLKFDYDNVYKGAALVSKRERITVGNQSTLPAGVDLDYDFWQWQSVRFDELMAKSCKEHSNSNRYTLNCTNKEKDTVLIGGFNIGFEKGGVRVGRQYRTLFGGVPC